MTTIPWHLAVLCVSCNTVSNANSEACPVCSERGLLNLSKVVDRKPPTAAQKSRNEAAA